MDITSTVNARLDRHYHWVNTIVVAAMQIVLVPSSFLWLFSTDFYTGATIETIMALAALMTTLISTTALYWRYRAPVSAPKVGIICCFIGCLIAPLPIFLAPVSMLLAYHVGRHWQRQMRLRILMLSWVASLLVALNITFLSHLPTGSWVTNLIGALMVFAFVGTLLSLCWFIGDSRRSRAERQDAYRVRVEQLEREQAQERAMATQDERARIAREMHDIVAHSLSSIITQADGARFIAAAQRGDKEPDIAEQTLDTIAETARESLTQMRSLLGVLRTDEGTLFAPLPTLNDIPELIEQTRQLGLPLHWDGITGTMRGMLPQGAELAAYRVVQEALTNILKHARSTPLVRVRVDWTRAGIEVDIYNAAPESGFSALPGSGNGLRGMRERVEMYNGTISYGPVHDADSQLSRYDPKALSMAQGFRVQASLPYRDA